eukprot:TRINITY_DN6900_c0_g1_i1.p1 TRINITY_DN6900_c0_g1~~TRINITY_DN6900_c0_g1_i1.p1  ORF type:complete len:301 (+),score=79.64 TRINITY_DN6900_c0_g1_i1:55-957(+)
MAAALLGDQLITKNGLRSTAEALRGVNYVVLYFSASWCPPCQQFTPQLADFYAHKQRLKCEIVFVTNDRDEQSMMQYYTSKMPWTALPYGSPGHQRCMSAGFCGRGIPDICILDMAGRPVKKGAVQNVLSDMTGQYFPWPEAPLTAGATFEFPVELTLEELAAGCTKKRKITRKRVQGGQVVDEATVLEIATKPGWKAGTKVTFPGESDQTLQHAAGDVVFVVKEKPHPLFTRRDADLVHAPTLSAAGDRTVSLTLLDGTTEVVTVAANGTATLKGKGMPVRKGGQQVGVGDLVVEPVWR